MQCCFFLDVFCRLFFLSLRSFGANVCGERTLHGYGECIRHRHRQKHIFGAQIVYGTFSKTQITSKTKLYKNLFLMLEHALYLYYVFHITRMPDLASNQHKHAHLPSLTLFFVPPSNVVYLQRRRAADTHYIYC